MQCHIERRQQPSFLGLVLDPFTKRKRTVLEPGCCCWFPWNWCRSRPRPSEIWWRSRRILASIFIFRTHEICIPISPWISPIDFERRTSWPRPEIMEAIYCSERCRCAAHFQNQRFADSLWSRYQTTCKGKMKRLSITEGCCWISSKVCKSFGFLANQLLS